MSDITNEVTKVVGKTVERIEVCKNCYDEESGFTMFFTDGTEMSVSSRGYSDCSSTVSVDVQ